jgi:predicted metal-dependent phosphoesterase TrpH
VTVISIRTIGIGGTLVAALVAGTIADRPKASVRRELGGYHVLSADLHVHSFPISWSTLSAWDTVIEAKHQGLDAIVMTPHNHVWVVKLGRWFSQITGGPLVIVGEELTSSRYHMLAIGISTAVSSRQPAARAIEEVHRQGGVAVAAHPYPQFQPAYDAEAIARLDGSEVVRPDAQNDERAASELRDFFERSPRLAAIGSTDFHGLGPLGYSRTYIFGRDRSEQGVIDAIRERRTVVYDRDRVFGDRDMIALASANGGLPHDVPVLPVPGGLPVFSRIAALLALTATLLFNRW